ncbi:MAG TPA: TetR/AcrR family transcriptional regulator [Gemmatimonadales bacterium]
MDTSPDQSLAGLEARPSRQRQRPEERREAILDAALRTFSELGYTQATLNDVADRLGVTKGCLYHYFESKEKLLVDLIRDRMGSAAVADGGDEAVVKAGGTREEVLRGLLERIWQRLHQPGQADVAILAMTELPKVPEGGRLVFDEVVCRSRESLHQLLGEGRYCENITDEDIERAARVIPLMIMGVALGTRMFRSLDPVQLSVDQVGKTVTDILMYGLLGTCPQADEADSGS